MKYLKFEEFKLNEYLDQNTLQFYNYIKDGSDDDMYIELAYNGGHLILNFIQDLIELEEIGDYFTKDELKTINSTLSDNTTGTIDEFDTQEILLDLISKKSDFMVVFGRYVYDATDESEYPSTFFFEEPKIVKKQWLIHLTDYASNIWKEGFTHGTPYVDKLGLTTYVSHQYKNDGGYNFAYTQHDFNKYGTNGDFSHNFKYGCEAILFRSSGVRVWHIGDEEYQTVFWGDNASDIIWMEYGDNGWFIESRITGDKLVEKEEINDLILWVEKHYGQYRKHLINKK